MKTICCLWGVPSLQAPLCLAHAEKFWRTECHASSGGLERCFDQEDLAIRTREMAEFIDAASEIMG